MAVMRTAFRLKKHTVSAEASVATGFFAGCARRAMIVERFQFVEEKHVWHVRNFHVLRIFHVNAAGTSA
jgi:hypothetical protein